MSKDSNYHQLYRQDLDVCTSWKQLTVDEEFCDMTLACNGAQFVAHKAVISSFSPVLRHIFKQNPSQYKFIYLRGVTINDLKNLITYIYQGEVAIHKQDLKSFLEISRYLKVRGILGGKEENSEKKDVKADIFKSKLISHDKKIMVQKDVDLSSESVVKPILPITQYVRRNYQKCIKEESDDTEINTENFENLNEDIETKVNSENEKSLKVVVTAPIEKKIMKKSKSMMKNYKVKCGFCKALFQEESELEEHIALMLTSEIGRMVHQKIIPQRKSASAEKQKKPKRDPSLPNGGVPRAICHSCGIEQATKWTLKEHIKKHHEDAFRQPIACHLCTDSENGLPPPAKFWTQYNLDKHINLCHNEANRSNCVDCGQQFNTKRALKIHVEKKHLGIKYKCEECLIEVSTKKILQRHIKVVHRQEGKYPCKECGKIFKYQSRAIEHEYKDRGEARYKCNKCDFESPYGWALSKHKPLCS